MSKPLRPDLQFGCYEDLIADVDRLRTTGWAKSGQWSLAMNCDHLTRWMNAMLDGGLPQIPRPFHWIARAVVRRMAGKRKYPTIKFHAPAALKPASDISESDAVDAVRAAIARLQQLPGPTVDTYPFGPLPADDFHQMTLLHAAHHLAFLACKQQVKA
jgi:Protein of unknown function (DUF1569)